jgi:general stress protein CsbA
MRGLSLAGSAGILVVVLAGITFGVAPTLTVLLAAASVTAGMTMMHRTKEEP